MSAPGSEPGSAVVVGLGLTGRAVAARLVRLGWRVVALDDRPRDGLVATADQLGVELVDGTGPAGLGRAVEGATEVILSPGVPLDHPVHAAATEANVAVTGEIELAWRLRGEHPPTLVAVTGTNGKTTVTTLVDDALRRSGLRSLAAGNIGLPLIEALDPEREGEPLDVVVAEVSSFQLQSTRSFRPDVACWLNFTPDHLDWHPDLAHYRAAKARIWANQGPGDTAVANADDPVVMEAAASRPHGVDLVTYSAVGAGDWREEGAVLRDPTGATVLPVAALPRALPHDRSNALAAAAVAGAAGATLEATAAALAAPRRMAHRVELVAEAGGVSWYDDSKATTPASVLAAVAGFDSVVLIAGGRNKGLDLSVLAATTPPVRAVVAIGEARAEVEAAYASSRATVTSADSMGHAVACAAALAEAGDAVILSPGCTSYDWYADYGQRGDHFAACVHDALTGASDLSQ